jgi:phage/plasmid-like protein (TIGR03299 family)
MDTSTALTPISVVPAYCGVGKQISVRNIREALEQTGLNFTVSQQKMVIIGNDVQPELDLDENVIRLSKESVYNGLRFNEMAPIVRDDTRQVLTCMGSGYTILQNIDCAGVFEDVLQEDSAIMISHGGNLKNCEKLWLSARLPDHIQIGPDRIEKTLNILWSHTGKLKLSINFVPWLSRKGISLNTGEVNTGAHAINIRHTSGGPQRLAEARKILQKARNFYSEIEELFKRLYEAPTAGMTVTDMTRYLELLFPDTEHDPEDGLKHKKGRNEGHRERILGIFRSQPEEINLTKWAAFTSVCEWVDTEMTVKTSIKKGHESSQVRLDSVWFGTGAKTKGNAFKQLLAL